MNRSPKSVLAQRLGSATRIVRPALSGRSSRASRPTANAGLYHSRRGLSKRGNKGVRCFWGRAKLFGLLGGVLGAARSVCSHAAEKIRSPLGLRGKPSAAVSGGKPEFLGCYETSLVLRSLCAGLLPKIFVCPEASRGSRAGESRLPRSGGKPSAAALVRRGNVDTNTKCSVDKMASVPFQPWVHSQYFWGQAKHSVWLAPIKQWSILDSNQ